MDCQAQEGNQQEMREEGRLSISGLIRKSVFQLENECRRLEKEYDDTVAENTVLQEICTTQEKNISKQQADLQHLKLMVHTAAMNRETSTAKIADITNKVQKLENKFTSWFGTINALMSSREALSQIHTDKMTTEEQQQEYCKGLEANFKSVLSQVQQTKNELLETKEKERQQFDHITAHLKSQLESQTEEEIRLKNQLEEIRDCKKEKIIMINTIRPDCDELELAVNQMKQTMSNETKEIDFLINQLRGDLQEIMGKKEILGKQVENADTMINEKNNLIRDLDLENKILETNLKEQIAKEDELIKIKEEELKTLKSLELDNAAMKEKFATLQRIEKENTALKLQCQEMGITIQEWDSNIDNIKCKEKSCTEELQKQDALIKTLEEERKVLIDEQVMLDEKLVQLQKQMDENTKDHTRKSAEIDIPFNSLTKENELQQQSNAEMELLVKEANERRCVNEDVIENLKAELEKVKTISEQNDLKVINEKTMQDENFKALKKEETDLDDGITKTIQEYEEALIDAKICMETEEQIQNLEIQIANNKETFEISFNALKASHQKEKEEKEFEKEKQRIQYEREFRIKEQTKTDALVELKEINLRVLDIQQQMKTREEEIIILKGNVVKCDNLLQNLEGKLRTVAQVAAATEASQSLSTFSQTSSLLETPRPKKRRPTTILSPAGSEANLSVYQVKEHTDIGELMKNPPKRMSNNSNNNKKTNPEKKRPDPDWGF